MIILSFFHTGYHCNQWPRLGSVSDHGLVVVVILQEVNIWVLVALYLLCPCSCCLVLVLESL